MSMRDSSNLAPALAITVLALSVAPASAQAEPVRVQVPAQFHGRWADNVHDCMVHGPATSAVTIDAHGWAGYEEGGRVTGALPPLNGATRFDTTWSGENETARQMWSLRLLGARLYWLTLMRGAAPFRETLVRCPAR